MVFLKRIKKRADAKVITPARKTREPVGKPSPLSANRRRTSLPEVLPYFWKEPTPLYGVCTPFQKRLDLYELGLIEYQQKQPSYYHSQLKKTN